ncbi:MAG: DMT family transporter [Anaerolineales bacterium]|jgi:drug/metabolite transporter (DMT)-like permease
MSEFQTPRRATLTLSLLAGVVAVSTAAIFIRFAQQEGSPSIVIAAARLTIASLVLAPFALTRYRSDLHALSKQEWILALLSGLFLALHFGTWITSLEYTSVASSVVLVSTTPLWVAILAPLVLRERLGIAAGIGLILALSGGTIVGLSDTCTWQSGAVTCPPLQSFFAGRAALGDLLALTGAWMAAGYILAGRKLRSKMELIPYVFIVYGMAAIVLIVIMLGLRESPVGLPPLVYLWFILLALIPQLLGHSTFNWALKYLPASFVSVALLGEPVGSTILAYFIFLEQPGWTKIGGAVLILIGIWMASRGEKK